MTSKSVQCRCGGTQHKGCCRQVPYIRTPGLGPWNGLTLAKVQMLLGDCDTYQPVAKDPTGALQRRMNSVLWSLNVCARLRVSDGTYCRLNSSVGGVPHLYGLPKVYKPDIPGPLWLIASFVSSPTLPPCYHRVSA